MLRRVVSLSLRFRVLLVFAAVAVMFGGFAQLAGAPKDVYPEFEPPTVEIQTEALGLSAQEVEQLITVPLEADLLNGVAWVDDIRSESVLGLSSVTMVFEPGTDLYRARQAVQERLSQAHALPNVSKPPQMLQPKSSTSRAMMVGLTSSNAVAHRALAARPVDHQAAPAGRGGRRQRRQLRPARAPAPGAGRPPDACRQGRRAPAGRRVHRQLAVGVAADVPRGVFARHRRLHRDAEPAPRRAARVPDRVGRRPREDRDRRQARSSRWPTSPQWSRTTSPSSVTRRSTAAPASFSSSRSCAVPTPST